MGDDLSERPRVDDWSFRAALVRFAQVEPVRAGAVLELIRRFEWASQSGLDDRDGRDSSGALLDRLGDVLAHWASSRPGDPPVAEIDDLCRAAYRRMDEAGIGHDTGPPYARRGPRAG